MGLSEVQYMDDWCSCASDVETKSRQWSVVMMDYGLRLNPKKSQVHFSPWVSSVRPIVVNGVSLSPFSHLMIMGLPFRAGVSSSELLGDKFF